MTVNSYFNSSFKSVARDQKLKEDLIIESIQINGLDINYLPRTDVNFDSLFGEDQSSTFTQSFPVEMYLKSVDGFGGDGHFLSKFGLEIRDEIIMEVSIRRFNEAVVANIPEILRPREGDLIQLPIEMDNRNRLFEISYVDEDYINHQLGAIHTYEIRAKVFEMGGETFTTGDETIDSTATDVEVTYILNITGGSGTFTVGESVSQANDFTAVVKSLDGTTLELATIHGMFDSSIVLVGDTSGASRTVELVTDVGNVGLEDNNYIDEHDDDIIDFTVTNPFSEG